MENILPFLAIICLGLAIRLYAGSRDAERLRAYVEERGGELLSSTWKPFGRGWFGDKSDRIYEVRYLDRDGNKHMASCKTSMFSGVYFTEDEIVSHRVPPAVLPGEEGRVAGLERENTRLRAELDRLRARRR